jgi:transposase InsO family protein
MSSASAYKASKLASKDELLRQQILSALSSHPSYGHRRIAISFGVGKKRVRRVMKLNGIKPYKRKARWRKRRNERRPESPYQNLIKSICSLRPGVVYVGDFTYLRRNSETIYLATFMDLFTREVVGWSISTKHTTEFVVEAFWDAVMSLGLPKIAHTDQGTEYCSKEYTELMNTLNVQISTSKESSPWENACQESFYNNFKTELGLEFERFNTIGELVEAIHQTINYYNHRRIHTTLKMSPTVFRHKHLY